MWNAIGAVKNNGSINSYSDVDLGNLYYYSYMKESTQTGNDNAMINCFENDSKIILTLKKDEQYEQKMLTKFFQWPFRDVNIYLNWGPYLEVIFKFGRKTYHKNYYSAKRRALKHLFPLRCRHPCFSITTDQLTR